MTGPAARTTASGVRFLSTPERNFEHIGGFPYAPQHLDLDGLQMAYVDEGPRDAPVALMVHGMPTWGYLYRHMIRRFLAAGFRCVVPDHIGFGRSDKVITPEWYTIARHAANLRRLIEALDLEDVTLVVQDWGGPIGLASYAEAPHRFSRLVIMNTWLHHDSYEYSPGILQWIEQNSPGGLFRESVPGRFQWGTLMAMATERVSPQDSVLAIAQGGAPRFGPEAMVVKAAYDAPFDGLGDDGVAGTRRFPLSIPAGGTNADNAAAQREILGVVNATSLPVHFAWGVKDRVFTEAWGRQWHSSIPHATWFQVDAGHFLQDTHGAEIADHVIEHIR